MGIRWEEHGSKYLNCHCSTLENVVLSKTVDRQMLSFPKREGRGRKTAISGKIQLLKSGVCAFSDKGFVTGPVNADHMWLTCFALGAALQLMDQAVAEASKLHR